MKNTVESAVVVPVLQAGVSGLFVGFAVLSGCAAFGWPWSWAGVSGCVTVLCAWWVFRAEVQRRLDAESGLLQPVPVQAQPVQPEPVQAFALTVAYNEGRAGDMMRFGVSPEKFSAWCEGVASGQSLGENHWTGRHAAFSKGEYHRFLGELLRAGYIRQRGRACTLGYELTKKGACLARNITPSSLAFSRTHFPA